MGAEETWKMIWLLLLFQGGGSPSPKHCGCGFVCGRCSSVWPYLEIEMSLRSTKRRVLDGDGASTRCVVLASTPSPREGTGQAAEGHNPKE